MLGLTKRQKEVLEYIRNSIEKEGYPPTIREIGAALSMRSTNGVNDHLKALERKGFIERNVSKSRAIMLTDAGVEATGEGQVVMGGQPSGERDDIETIDVPMLGAIAAGQPIAAIEDADNHVRMDMGMLGGRGGDIFALSVSGESMIEDGICDGDTIFVRRQSVAARGEIVAVMVDGAATVKRFFPEGDRVRLEPANAAMSPIYLSAQDARESAILGKVVGLYRRM